MNWIRQLFDPNRYSGDLAEEIREHLQEKTEELIAGGMSAKDAAAAAHREFGNVSLVEQDSRQIWRWPRLENLLIDVRYALRSLGKTLGFTTVAVLTLAFGIGATTAIYSILYATLLEPLPYPQPEQLVMIWSLNSRGRAPVSAADYFEWRHQSAVFQDMNAANLSGQVFNLSGSSRPEQIQAQVASPDYYKMMGMHFALGRNFLPEEGQLGKHRVVILTNQFWRSLGANRDIVGQQLRLSGELYTVVGVTDPGPLDRIQFQVVVPLSFKPGQINHEQHWLMVMARLKPGVSLSLAQADMDVISSRLAKDHPITDKNWEAHVEPLQDDFLPESVRSTLWLLMGTVAFVLLIACANVANLLLARGTTRLKEIAVRTALGASRWQIFSQLLTESLVLALLGGGLGIGLSAVILRLLLTVMPAYTLPSEADVRLSLPVLLFALAATTLAGIFFGCAPAWQASQVDPNETLKDGGRFGPGSGRSRLRQVLVVAEFALALTLLAGAGMAIHSFWKLAHLNLGVRTDHILTFGLPVPQQRFTQPEQIVAFHRQVLENISKLPGVVQAAALTGLPLHGTPFGARFSIAGRHDDPFASRPSCGFRLVTPGYFDAFAIAITKGRAFNEHDVAGGLRVGIVNESFVHHFLGNVDPIGQRIVSEQIVFGATETPPLVEWQIVGVFRDFRNGNLRRDAFPEMDVPLWQSPWPDVSVAVRTLGDPADLTNSVASIVNAVEPDLPLSRVRTMEQIVDETLFGDRFNATLYGSFAAVALGLAAVGIYGLMAFAVAQRTSEIGLRMALGAARGQVLAMILKEGIVLALLGLVLGLVGAYFVGRAMQGLLYGVRALDFVAFAAVSAALLAAALLACYLPARRAARVDPMVALRHS